MQESISSFENLRFRSGASTRSLVSFYDSVREHQPGVSCLLRFRSGASTRSLVSACDSVREHQPGVSYFLFLRFHLRNVTNFRIKFDFRRKYEKKIQKKKKSVVLDKICVFCLYPIPDSQQCVKRGSCRRLILSGLPRLFLFLFLFEVILRIFKFSVFKLCRNYLL